MKYFIKNCATIIFILLLTLSLYKCNTNRQESPIAEKLYLQKMTPIKVPEPSGLALSFDGKYFRLAIVTVKSINWIYMEMF